MPMPAIIKPGGLTSPVVSLPSDKVVGAGSDQLIAPWANVRLLAGHRPNCPLAIFGGFNPQPAPSPAQVERDMALMIRAAR